MAHTNVLDSFKLTGKVALVTGGGQGLGRTIALALGEAGADVAIAGRTLSKAQDTAKELEALTGRRVEAFAADVTKGDDVTRLAQEVAERLGPVDILVNNAGNNIRGLVQELSEADWDSVLDTNLKGTFLCSRAIGPEMAKRGWGRVINLGSILSIIAMPGRGPYASAKAGVTALTRVLALEWADKGVTVNAICPGPFGTEMNRTLLNDPVKYQEFVKQLPVGRWGELDELAGLVVYLASPGSSFMTGASLFIDGGWTAR
jgi:NAD(P)-dependent dehydrogenase (short-subunit alcohol dehydrogenase family)